MGLLLEERSGQSLHCLPFCLFVLESFHCGYIKFLGVQKLRRFTVMIQFKPDMQDSEIFSEGVQLQTRVVLAKFYHFKTHTPVPHLWIWACLRLQYSNGDSISLHLFSETTAKTVQKKRGKNIFFSWFNCHKHMTLKHSAVHFSSH